MAGEFTLGQSQGKYVGEAAADFGGERTRGERTFTQEKLGDAGFYWMGRDGYWALGIRVSL